MKYQFYESYEFENLAAFATENLKSFKAALYQKFYKKHYKISQLERFWNINFTTLQKF